jgi:hypothetical protein
VHVRDDQIGSGRESASSASAPSRAKTVSSNPQLGEKLLVKADVIDDQDRLQHAHRLAFATGVPPEILGSSRC